MHYLHRIAAFLVIALSLAGCQSWYPVVTMYVTPTGGSIDTTLSLANVRNLRLVQLPGDSYAIVRTNPDNEGYGVVGLDSALAPQWTYPVPFRPGYGMTPIWLSGGPAGVTLVYKEYDSRDSFSIKGILLNAENGALLQSRHLAGFSLLTHVSVTREQQLVFSPDSTFFALYRYDYSNLDDNDRKTVRLVAEMFDTKLDRIGGVNLEIPVGNDVDDADDAEPYVQSFFLSGDGYGYQVSYHETAMLRVTRIDFRSGTTEMLEKDIPGVDFDNDRKLSGTKGWTGNGGEVLVAANLIEEKALSKIELVAMNFKSGSVEFNRSIDVDPTLPHFRVRDVSRAPGREIILAVEQVIEYRVYDGPDRTTYASSLAYMHTDMIVFGLDREGYPAWQAVQKRYGIMSSDINYQSDSWRIEGDTIRCVYRADAALGYVSRSISTRTGQMTPPRSLLRTNMDGQNHNTRWLAGNRILLVLADSRHYRLVRMAF